MFEEQNPTVSSLTCPRCGEATRLEIPLDLESDPGAWQCSAGHDLFNFEDDTLGTLVSVPVR